MKVGLFINTQFPEGESVAARIPELVEQVRLARQSGFSSMLFPHHYLTDPLQMLQIGPMINKQLAAFDHHHAAIQALTRRDGAATCKAITSDLSEARETLIARMRAEQAEEDAKPVRTRRARLS